MAGVSFMPRLGGGGYRALPVTFDGTNDNLLRGANLSGNADGKKGIFSCWLRWNGGNGSLQFIISTSTTNFRIFKTAGNVIQIDSFQTDGVSISAQLVSSTAITSGATWRHLLASWDASAATRQFYLNSTSDLASSSSNNANGAYSTSVTDYSIGSSTAGASRVNADIADMYLNLAESIDLSVQSNREKFIFGGRPVDLGATGTNPTGSQPIIFLKGPASSFQTNNGSGGNFSVTGALTDATGSPSD